MNKLFLAILFILVVGLGWFLFSDTDTFDYVVTVDQEVSQLETELAELDAAVEAGTLTPEQATNAKVKILNRLDAINTSVDASNSGKLTPAQQKQLNEGLNRLKTILITYRATLTAVDEGADDEVVKAQLNRGKDGSQKLSTSIAETIDTVQTTVEEVVDEYVPYDELDEQVDTILDEEATSTEDIEEEMNGEVIQEEDETMDSTTDTESDEDLADETPMVEEAPTSTEEDYGTGDETEPEIIQ